MKINNFSEQQPGTSSGLLGTYLTDVIFKFKYKLK